MLASHKGKYTKIAREKNSVTNIYEPRLYIKYLVVGSPVTWKQACIIYDTTVLKGCKSKQF